MKKVLIVGANSYIGKKFKGYVETKDIKSLLVDTTTASDESWRKVELSIYDVIIHMSAVVHKKEKKNMENLYKKVNHKLAVEIAIKAKEAKVKQFIFMSTAAVFGNESSCITKETIPKPVSYYGKTKLAAERDIEILKDSNFKVAIIRPPMVYGEGCKGNYAKLEKLAKLTPIFPEYHNKRSVLHIDTLSEYLYKIILKEQEGYFHPQDKVYMDTCYEVAKIRKQYGKKIRLIKIPKFIIKRLSYESPLFKKVFGDFYYNRTLDIFDRDEAF